MNTYTPLPIPPAALRELRERDDSGQPPQPYTAGVDSAFPDSAFPDCVGSLLRCCLRAAEPGDRVALVSYAPLRRWAAETGATPGAYVETGPVFVHADACDVRDGDSDSDGTGTTTGPQPPRTPGYPFARPGAQRLLRRYDARGHIVGGERFEVPPGTESVAAKALDAALDAAFAAPEVALVHVRAVEYGCFQFEVRRP
ncbi:DUF1203 domain-containing protein [Streptomyces sp. NBC_00237]|uniref:DUF1203 domain-containing protein n=1 Tax=Streptomyces sp. NBC_00237 TaxID=2975687 RepID=UPI00224DB484|nr:DUF1203 domain-containing protein [Streptomyces sp. NBC_00237]MCX5205205.1 DUF1203 domain-containing protein [Streptomyces sp. NBC_00237]